MCPSVKCTFLTYKIPICNRDSHLQYITEKQGCQSEICHFCSLSAELCRNSLNRSRKYTFLTDFRYLGSCPLQKSIAGYTKTFSRCCGRNLPIFPLLANFLEIFGNRHSFLTKLYAAQSCGSMPSFCRWRMKSRSCWATYESTCSIISEIKCPKRSRSAPVSSIGISKTVIQTRFSWVRKRHCSRISSYSKRL